MKYEVYLFDFDYTLADSERGIVMCFEHVFEQYGFKGISKAAIKATIGYTVEDALSQLTGVKDPVRVQEMRSMYSKKSEEVMAVNTKLYPATIPLLEAIKKNGGRVAIVSTKKRIRINESIAAYKMESLVDAVIGGEDVTQAKPSPEGLLKAMDTLKAEKQHTLYFGDSVVDSEAAQSAGVDFVGLLTGTTPKSVFEKAPYVKIAADLHEVLNDGKLFK
jgi:phosphoglycolate phosphatase